MSPADHEDDLVAAELAFGLLDADEADAARRRLASEPAFAAAYDRWTAHAAAMAATDLVPRPSLWNEIVLRIPGRRRPRIPVGWWQAGTATGFAAAAAAIVFALSRPAPLPIVMPVPAAAQAPLVAVLTGKENGIVTISYDHATGHLTVAPIGLAVAGKATELWVIANGRAPASLGVIASQTPTWRLAPTAARAVAAGATLAVSVEPAGGSPTGAPTGPVILTGKVTPV